MPTKQILRKGGKERGLKDSSNLKQKQCGYASFSLALHDYRERGLLQECCINNGRVHEPLILSYLHS